jgi:hypothetical protein
MLGLIYLHTTTLRLVPILTRATILRTPYMGGRSRDKNSTSTPLEGSLLKQTWTATHLLPPIFLLNLINPSYSSNRPNNYKNQTASAQLHNPNPEPLPHELTTSLLIGPIDP